MTPEQIKIIMAFLERGTYSGKEFPAYATVMQALQNALTASGTTPSPHEVP